LIGKVAVVFTVTVRSNIGQDRLLNRFFMIKLASIDRTHLTISAISFKASGDDSFISDVTHLFQVQVLYIFRM
jgi:hypothetical protein